VAEVWRRFCIHYIGVIVKRAILYLLIIAALPLGIAEFRQYRVNSAISAGNEFAPRTNPDTMLPAGTRIRAILKMAFTESTKPGDRVIAFVSEAVTVDGKTPIPAGTKLNGFIKEITPADRQALLRLNFASLDADVMIDVPIQTDLEVLGTALDTMGEAGVGLSLGAASRSEEAAAAGLAAGALRGASVLDKNDREITVILTKPISGRSIRADADPGEPADEKGNDRAPHAAHRAGASRVP
jgi:hypothetical protein